MIGSLAEDEAEGVVELDEEDVDDDEGSTPAEAGTERFEDIGQRAQTAGHQSEGEPYETDAEGDNGHQGAAEGRWEERARGGKQDGMWHEREQTDDAYIYYKEREADTTGDLIPISSAPFAGNSHPQTTTRDKKQDQPHEPRRGYRVIELADEPADALGGEQGAHTL